MASDGGDNLHKCLRRLAVIVLLTDCMVFSNSVLLHYILLWS